MVVGVGTLLDFELAGETVGKTNVRQVDIFEHKDIDLIVATVIVGRHMCQNMCQNVGVDDQCMILTRRALNAYTERRRRRFRSYAVRTGL